MYPSNRPVRSQKVRAACRPGNAFIEPLEHRLLFSKPFGTRYAGFGDYDPGSTFIEIPPTLNGPSAALDQLADDSAGNLYAGGNYGIARFTSAGVVDTTFGNAGLAALPGSDTFIAEAGGYQAQLYALLGSSVGTVLARYTSAGIIDTTFGHGGTALVTSDSHFTATSVAVESDGQPVVAGTESTDSGDSAEMRVFRLDTNGTLDTSFGTDGSFAAYLGTSASSTPIIYDQVAGVRTLADGEILVGGGSISYSNGGSRDTLGPAVFAVARITATGQLDGSYASGGIARSQFASAATLITDDVSSPRSIQIAGFDARPDGSVVFAGDNGVQDFTAAIGAFGVASYDVAWSPQFDVAQAETPNLVAGVAALSGGGSDVLTGVPYAGDVAVTSISSSGEVGQAVTTFDTSAESPAFSGSGEASFLIAPSGKIAVGGSWAGDGYSVVELNPGSGFTPAFSGFPGGTASSIATFSLVQASGVYVEDIDVAYYSTKTDSLMFAEELGNGLWTTPVSVGPTSGVDQYFSLQIRGSAEGNNPKPYIAFYDLSSRSLKLARSSDGGRKFKIVTLDSSANVGLDASLNFNPSNNAPEVTYYDQTHHEVKFATEDSKGKWVTSVIDSKVDVGDQSAAGLTDQSAVGVAFLDSTTGQILLAEQDSDGKWDIGIAAEAKNGVGSLSLSYTGDGLPTIAYYDIRRKELRDVVFSDDPTYTFTVYSAALGKFEDVNAQDGAIYAYNPATNSVVEYQTGGQPGSPDTVIRDGGPYLEVAEDPFAASLLAFVDPQTGNLMVGPLYSSSGG